MHKIKFGSQTGYFGAFRQREQAIRYTLHIYIHIIIIIIVKEGYLLTISGQSTGHWTETGLVSATSKLHSLSYYDRQNQTHVHSPPGYSRYLLSPGQLAAALHLHVVLVGVQSPDGMTHTAGQSSTRRYTSKKTLHSPNHYSSRTLHPMRQNEPREVEKTWLRRDRTLCRRQSSHQRHYFLLLLSVERIFLLRRPQYDR